MRCDRQYLSHKSTVTSSQSSCPKSSNASFTSQHSQSIWVSNMSAEISNESRYALRTLQGCWWGLTQGFFPTLEPCHLNTVASRGCHQNLDIFLMKQCQLVAEWPRCLHALQTNSGSHAQRLWSGRAYHPWEVFLVISCICPTLTCSKKTQLRCIAPAFLQLGVLQPSPGRP